MAETPISVIDMEGVNEAILSLVSKYPKLPFPVTSKTVQWQNIEASEGIGLFSMQGGIYLRRYVDGSFVGQMPFRMVYRAMPTTNATRLGSQNLLEDVARWLETCDAKFLDTSIELQSINRTSPVFKSGADNNGIEEYTCSMTVKYYQSKLGGN